MSTPSELIDELVAATPDWRGAAFARLRAIIHDADPDITEEVKWKRPSNPLGAPVFEHNGIVCTANILKERVRLSFPAGLSLPDPQKIADATTGAAGIPGRPGMTAIVLRRLRPYAPISVPAGSSQS